MKDSPRHRELKEKLAERLLREPGAPPERVRQEGRVPLNERFRRPDVACEYRGRAAPRSAVLDPILARLFPGLLLAHALSP